jgi:hypothetical protein
LTAEDQLALVTLGPVCAVVPSISGAEAICCAAQRVTSSVKTDISDTTRSLCPVELNEEVGTSIDAPNGKLSLPADSVSPGKDAAGCEWTLFEVDRKT